ncbi:ParA family protein [Vibrio breoganii]
MKVFGFANQKGGVGKTTTLINLASELAKNKQVLVIDLDPQSNCTKALTSKRGYGFDMSVAAMFDKPKVISLNDIIIPALDGGEDVIDNLYIAPSDFSLSKVIETSLTKINREQILEKQLKKLEKQYDYVLLDTPPNLSLTTLNALKASEFVIIPVDSGAFSLDGIDPLLEAIEEVTDEEPNYVIVRNEVDARNAIINDYLDDELETTEYNILPFQIRKTESIGQAHALYTPLRFYKPGSVVNNDYRKLAKFVSEEL